MGLLTRRGGEAHDRRSEGRGGWPPDHDLRRQTNVRAKDAIGSAARISHAGPTITNLAAPVGAARHARAGAHRSTAGRVSKRKEGRPGKVAPAHGPEILRCHRFTGSAVELEPDAHCGSPGPRIPDRPAKRKRGSKANIGPHARARIARRKTREGPDRMDYMIHWPRAGRWRRLRNTS